MPGKVLISGAGPGGGALAYLLARRGIAVTLVERQKDFAREFRGEALMPSGINAIAQMGLSDDFDGLAQARPRAVRIYRDTRLLADLRVDDEAVLAQLPRVVSQPEMLEMFVERASEFPNFRFLRGVAVSDLIHAGDRTVGARLRGESPETHLADLVIGGDGRTSIVRRKAGLADDHDAEHFDIVWFKVPQPDYFEDPAHTAQAYLARGHIMLTFPSHDGRMQVAWVIDKGTFGDLRRQGIEAWVDEMAAHAGSDFGDHLRRSKSALEHPFVLDVVCYTVPNWTAPGVMLLGDAAHPMSPVGGQGLNIALRDALVAANHLVPVLEIPSSPDPEAVDAATRAFQAERHPEVAALQRLQRIPPRVIFQRTWWARAALAVVPWVARLTARLGTGANPVVNQFAFGVTDVKLRV